MFSGLAFACLSKLIHFFFLLRRSIKCLGRANMEYEAYQVEKRTKKLRKYDNFLEFAFAHKLTKPEVAQKVGGERSLPPNLESSFTAQKLRGNLLVKNQNRNT